MGETRTEMSRDEAHPYVDADGCFALHGELFWKFRAADSDARLAELLVANQQRAFDEAVRADPKLARLQEKVQALRIDARAKREALAGVYAELEAVLGFPLQQVSIDDGSGKLYVVHGQDWVEVTQANVDAVRAAARPKE